MIAVPVTIVRFALVLRLFATEAWLPETPVEHLVLEALESPYSTEHLICPDKGIPRGVHCNPRKMNAFYLSCLRVTLDGHPISKVPYRATEGNCPVGYVCFRHGATEDISRGKWKEESGRPLSRIDCLTPSQKTARIRMRAEERRQRRQEEPDRNIGTGASRKKTRNQDVADSSNSGPAAAAPVPTSDPSDIFADLPDIVPDLLLDITDFFQAPSPGYGASGSGDCWAASHHPECDT